MKQQKTTPDFAFDCHILVLTPLKFSNVVDSAALFSPSSIPLLASLYSAGKTASMMHVFQKHPLRMGAHTNEAFRRAAPFVLALLTLLITCKMEYSNRNTPFAQPMRRGTQ